MTFLPANTENPLTELVELTGSLPPEVLAVSVGAFVGVGIFVVMMIAFSRRRPSRLERRFQAIHDASANDVVFIPPRRHPPHQTQQMRPVPVVAPQQRQRQQQPFDPGFTPSSALSARAFHKMGFDFAAHSGHAHAATAAAAIPRQIDEDEELASGEICVVGGTSPMPAISRVAAEAVVTQAPDPATRFVPEPLPSVECVFESMPSLSSLETGPASVVSVASPAQKEAAVEEQQQQQQQQQRQHSSGLMRAASIAELDLDDAPTHLREPLFDEPPQPRRRSTPPKIRKIDPTPPRAYRPYQPVGELFEQQPQQAHQEEPRRGMLPPRNPGLPPITPPPTQPQPIWQDVTQRNQLIATDRG